MKHLHSVCFLLLSCTCLLLCAVTPVRADIRREAEALVKWKASLAGADDSFGSWSMANSASLCRWTHITCDSARHIMDLNIHDISLNGTLDEFDFSAFPQLKSLFLSYTGLYGTIPAGIGNLTSLVTLVISSNPYLRGAIPRSIGQLKHLALLRLTSLGLHSTLPEEIGNLTKLEVLDLHSVTLTGSIPLTIGMLGKLQWLRLGYNKLTGSIPMEIGNMTELQIFSLDSNYLGGKLPGTISHLVKLHYLDLSENQLVGHIVPEPGNSSLLDTVSIANNNFLEGSLLGLGYLNLSGNHLSGCIPEDIGNLVLLESLDLSRNQLSGKIPQSLADLKSISVLNFSSNSLSGSIPTGDQLRTLIDPSIYSNNPGLCGFPLEDCINSSTPAQTEKSLDEDREALWLYCFVAAGFIFGFWLYWGIFMFRSETWRCAFYQYVDNMQGKVTKKMYNFMLRFLADGSG